MAEEVSGKKPLSTNERAGVRVMLSEREHRKWLAAQILKHAKWIGGTVALIAAFQLDMLKIVRFWIERLAGSVP